MTDTDTAIPQDVRALAAGIAADIERYGHYQGEGKHFGITQPEESCCIVLSPSTRRSQDSALVDLLALLPDAIVEWNDTTPTAEVLATLRRIAAGERP